MWDLSQFVYNAVKLFLFRKKLEDLKDRLFKIDLIFVKVSRQENDLPGVYIEL